ncbi:CRISPR-associated endonuclease Cas2 [Brevibacterium sp. R8603A2]|uniref:CRISPR-associated endonuclease Cas2 n=1 Tax=Brevibacterium sp. R8603A2 TaxID=2929779 RepID=UPI001FF9E124|nr:CRISPR-associated endonuclease Cas2 [Brevibacterium sp. R8603A2]MCK1804273.1 CRISPR-associated endonuclease Cas2 [Brevibacterium sp. R8603A2]
MSRDDARRSLIAYDVPDDRRRYRLAKALSRYGDRIQYSVFVVDVAPAKLLRLRSEVSSIIDAEEDSVLFCDLGLRRSLNDSVFSYIGAVRTITDDTSIIL